MSNSTIPGNHEYKTLLLYLLLVRCVQPVFGISHNIIKKVVYFLVHCFNNLPFSNGCLFCENRNGEILKI